MSSVVLLPLLAPYNIQNARFKTKLYFRGTNEQCNATKDWWAYGANKLDLGG